MKPETMTTLLRRAIKGAGSLYPIEAATGVTRQTMMAFRDGASMRLDIADKLAKYFGVESRMAVTPRKGKRPSR